MIQLAPEVREVRVHCDALKPHYGAVPVAWRTPVPETSLTEDTDGTSGDSERSERETSPNQSETDEREPEAKPETIRGARICKPPRRLDW